MKPLVSIVIPVYNGEAYLQEAIESALGQTYNSIEVIVINDGSTDCSESIALRYGERIRYYAKDNGGVSTALNLGISVMHGEYFSWLSHDDLYYPEKIEKQVDALLQEKLQISYSDYVVIDAKGEKITTIDIAKKFPGKDLSYGLFPILNQVLNGCSLLIHKSYFEIYGTFDVSLRCTQDYDLWFKMLKSNRLAYVNQPLTALREHGMQVTHNYDHNRQESDELWLNMLKAITPQEAIVLNGSEVDFWVNMQMFLWCTPYKSAGEFAQTRLKALGYRKPFAKGQLRRVAYVVLSRVSRILRGSFLRKFVMESKLFHWGYNLWLGVRYR